MNNIYIIYIYYIKGKTSSLSRAPAASIPYKTRNRYT